MNYHTNGKIFYKNNKDLCRVPKKCVNKGEKMKEKKKGTLISFLNAFKLSTCMYICKLPHT